MKKMLFSLFVLVTVSLCTQVKAQIFIVFDDLKGESIAPDHQAKNETQINSLTFGGANLMAIGSATSGAGAGRVKFDEITIMKPRGTLSSDLFNKMSAGGHYNNVKIMFYKTGQPVWMTITLTTVFVTSMSMAADGTDAPSESIKLAFGAIVFEETYPAPAGQIPKTMRSGWNVLTNTKM